MDHKETAEESKVEDIDIIHELLGMMQKQNMEEQSVAFQELADYIVGMQLQLGLMVDEMQGLKAQLDRMQNKQPKSITKQFGDSIAKIQEKAYILREQVSIVKESVMMTATQAVNALKEKGQEEMKRILSNGISGVKILLEGFREKMVDMKTEFEKTSNQIDSIGDELKQIGNSIGNVGRLLAGKGTKEVSEEVGVSLTRNANIPVKKTISALQKKMDDMDKMMEKLDKLTVNFSKGKETEKEKRISVKEKLSEMKVKAGQSKAEPEIKKNRGKEECL